MAAYRSRDIPMKMRTKTETERFFDGLELIDQGVTRVTLWHSGLPADTATGPHIWAGVVVRR